MAEAKQRTYVIVSQGDDGVEVEQEVKGTSAEFDQQSQRLLIKDGDEVVGGFIRLLRWFRKEQ
jgi:hypothetical protein